MKNRIPSLQLPVRYGDYVSTSLQSKQPFAYFLPEGVELGSEEKFPLLVLLHGHLGNYRDWSERSRLARHLSAYRLVVAMPDGGNGYYTNAVNGGERREDDLIEDFLPHLEATLPILPRGKNWGVAGLSMGGYGAIKLALKHWRTFSIGASFSGALNVPGRPVRHDVFGDPETDRATRKIESAFWQAEQALCRFPWERPRLFLDCGTSDPLFGESQMFSNHLNFLGYPHLFRELPGHHTWPYWDRAFRTLLPTLAETL